MKKLLIASVIGAACAPVALAAPSHYLKVSPSSTSPGQTVTVSGSVGTGCQTGHKHDSATVYSKAFAGHGLHNFAGIPAFTVSLAKGPKFSFRVKILGSKVQSGRTYSIDGRCGGGKFGSASLQLLGFY